MASPKALLANLREKRPALDHLIRAFGRYQADAGDRQAAAVTFFGFLSFFPILALATTVLSYALGPDAVDTVVEQVDAYAPGLADQLELRDILSADRAAGLAGLLGLLGLLYSGLGWVDALREAVRAVWHHNVTEGNFLVKKLKDVVILLGLGATLLVSIGISAASGAFSGAALEAVGLDESPVATVVTYVLGIALGLLTSTAIFLFLFWRLPKVQSPFRRVLRGALLAGVLFEVLKRVGALYIERTTENPIYGIFAVVVGLLVWINIVSRMLLIVAAWTVTAPYDSDVEPSGTANADGGEEGGHPDGVRRPGPGRPADPAGGRRSQPAGGSGAGADAAAARRRRDAVAAAPPRAGGGCRRCTARTPARAAARRRSSGRSRTVSRPRRRRWRCATRRSSPPARSGWS